MKPTILVATLIVVLAATFFLAAPSATEKTYSELDFVRDMDFHRFMGVWYDIASLPNFIEKGCKCPQSVDTLLEDLVIGLSESCVILGKNITSNSKAVAKTYGYGNWTNWNGPISAPYWIIKLDTDYQWVVIGQPSRKGFWIMSRKPTLDKKIVDELIAWGKQHQFDLSGIEYPDQSCFTVEGEEKTRKNLISE